MYNYYKHGREVEREMSEADRQRLEIKLRGRYHTHTQLSIEKRE